MSINLSKEISAFIDRYVMDIKSDSAAIFIGAGFSKSAGLVDWKNLLKGFAKELKLDIEKEYDLVSLVQYYYNVKGNRSAINDLIINEFSKENEPSENHKILARLPIFTYWTTNYDSLLEDALKETHKIADIKKHSNQFSATKHKRDAIVYKMHGDKENPNEAIFIKDDYERYHKEQVHFVTTLNADLISKTFLFLGFSFTDPNINYILSRLRVDYVQDTKQHYAIMRKVDKKQVDYKYKKKKFSLFIKDLKRYNIEVLLIDEYSEITTILQEISQRLNRNNIFISGSAAQYDKYDEKEAIEFITMLSKKLIEKGYNIISGFGLGVGSAVIIGALEKIYMKGQTIDDGRLLLRPFPQDIADDETRETLWHKYREDMISRAGISIFLFGNKLKDGKIIKADGVEKEFNIAKNCNSFIVPVACTGWIARQIWDEINKDLSKFYGEVSDDFKKSFDKLKEKQDNETMVDNILSFLEFVNKSKNG